MTDYEQLITSYLPLANKIAAVKLGTANKRFYFEDLQAAAYYGLVIAAKRFNPSLGVNFAVYARPCIEGAISDYIRKELCWAGKSTHQPQKQELDFDVEQISVSDEFDDLIGNLSVIEQDVLTKYFVHEFTLKEIADLHYRTEGWASKKISACKEKLKKCVTLAA